MQISAPLPLDQRPKPQSFSLRPGVLVPLPFLDPGGLGLMFELSPPLNLTPTAASGKKNQQVAPAVRV